MEWKSHRSLVDNYFNSIMAAVLFVFPLLLTLKSILKNPPSPSAHFIVWIMVMLTGYITYVYAFVARGPDSNVLLIANLIVFYIGGFTSVFLAKSK
jgi:beta-lactamase regulating signal transducer with metallopeptidase domain